DRRREVLASGAHRAQESRRARYFYRLRGRTERISRGDRNCVSQDRGAAVYRASGAGFAELRALETTQVDSRRSAIDLSRGDRGRSRAAAGGVRSEVESLPQREPGMAASSITDGNSR